MGRLAAIVIAAVVLTGCAMPLPITVASWAVDGLSLIATDKTLTDHGLSALAGQDCSLWRGFTEGDVCRDARDNVLVAAFDGGLALAPAPVEMAAAHADLDGPYLQVR